MVKYLSFLSCLLFLKGAKPHVSAASPPYSTTARRLDEKATDLSNGAQFSLNITNPPPGLEQAVDVPFEVQGSASIGLGEPDVAYIYIIDQSESTSSYDGPCGSVLDCVDAFFRNLNKEAISNGSAELAAVITFDDQAYLDAEFQDPTNIAIEEAINATEYSSGFTNCTGALLKAAELVEDPSNTAETTIVVFAGDGLCNIDDHYLHWASMQLEKTGAIVHTVAVGDNVNCTVSEYEENYMSDIPKNGGRCTSVADPHTLPDIIDDLIGTSLLSVELKVDESSYEKIDEGYLSGALPQEGAIAVNFNMTVEGLAVGQHEICVRATGNDTLGGPPQQLEDCHTVIVMPEPTPLSTGMIVLIVFSVLCGVFILAKCARRVLCRTKPVDLGDVTQEADDSPAEGGEGTSEAQIV